MSEPKIRPMTADDIEAVIAIAESLATAPHWPRSAYEAALDPAVFPNASLSLPRSQARSLASPLPLSFLPRQNLRPSRSLNPFKDAERVARFSLP